MVQRLLLALGLVLAALGSLTLPAQADEWQVDYAQSRVGVTVALSGRTISGHFATFEADINFDPQSAKGRVEARFPIAALTLGDPLVTSAAQQRQWLDPAQFPTAHFMAERFAKTGDGAYLASGTVSVRGKARPLSFPFALATSGSIATVEAEFPLLRRDFSIGTANPDEDAQVENRVTVSVKLSARRR